MNKNTTHSTRHSTHNSLRGGDLACTNANLATTATKRFIRI